MCNLYSVTKGQAAIIALIRALRDTTGNLPSMPGVFPDYMAPVVRNNGIRELAMLRWGMPGPPQFGGAPITNMRNVRSPHWRGWLKPENRCVVPFTSFCEYADTRPRKIPNWFALRGINARCVMLLPSLRSWASPMSAARSSRHRRCSR
jgi:putative SOS response-associated peptidase YedK